MPSQPEGGNVARRFSANVGSALIFNLATKIFTFSLTTLLTRRISATSRGVGFTLDVYTNTAMFLLREAVRMTTARIPLDPSDVDSIAAVANTASLSAVIAAVVVVLVGAASLVSQAALAPLEPLLGLGEGSSLWLALYGLGLAAELASEPILALSQSMLVFRTRIAAESLGLGFRLGTCLLLFTALGEAGVPPVVVFAAGQLAYGTAIFLYSSSRLWVDGATAQPEWRSVCQTLKVNRVFALGVTPGGIWRAASDHFSVWREFVVETVLRLALTEGERVVLATFGTLASQGVYDVVTNLSNVFARLVFRVWEDACFNAWAKMSGSLSSKREAAALLRRMLRYALYLGFVFAVFGPPMSRTALTLLYSARWATDEATAAMGASCMLTPLLGINGLTEAFVRATASEATLRRAKIIMTATSLTYVAASYAALQFGVVGLLYANCVNMLLRIAGSTWNIATSLELGVGATAQLLMGALDPRIAIASACLFVVCRVVPEALIVLVCAPMFVAQVVIFDSDVRAAVTRLALRLPLARLVKRRAD